MPGRSRLWWFRYFFFSDIFEDFFGEFGGGGSSRRTSNRGNDLRYDVNISLEEAFKGLEKISNIQHIKNVLPALGVGQPKDLNLLNVIIVLEEVRSELIKDSLRFNKLVHSVVVMGKLLEIHVKVATVMGKHKVVKM